MTLKEFKNILITLNGVKVFHNVALKCSSDYIIWYEIGQRRLSADNGTAERANRIGVDFFTKSEFTDIPEKLENLWDENEISYNNVTIIYEDDTGITHYAWTVEA